MLNSAVSSKHAGNGAADAAATAGETGAADHDRADGIQVEAAPEVAVAVANVAAQDQTGDGREQSAQHVRGDRHAFDVDAGEARRLTVATGGIQLATKGRLLQQHRQRSPPEQRQ